MQFGRRCREQVALAAGHHLKAILDSSINEYKDLIANEQLECEWRESGLLHVFKTQPALDAFAKENDWIQSEYQCGAKRISGADLPALDSTLRSDLAGGFLHAEDASLRPDQLNQSWRSKLEMLFPEKKIGVSPFEDGFRIGSMMEFVGFDETIPEYRVQQLKDSVRPYFNFELNETEQERWYGYRPMTYDTLPVIGPVPGGSNGFVATGHSMLGVSMAPATGRLIAEMITQQPTHLDAQAFSPARF